MKKEDLKKYDQIEIDHVEINWLEVIVKPTKNDGEETDIELLFCYDWRGKNEFEESELFPDELKNVIGLCIETEINKHFNT